MRGVIDAISRCPAIVEYRDRDVVRRRAINYVRDDEVARENLDLRGRRWGELIGADIDFVRAPQLVAIDDPREGGTTLVGRQPGRLRVESRVDGIAAGLQRVCLRRAAVIGQGRKVRVRRDRDNG